MRRIHFRRREFIAVLAGAVAAWPFAVRAQQPKMPVIGLLGTSSADEAANVTSALRDGLKESGFIEGQNLTIEYRWAHGDDDRLPALAVDLVQRQVGLIVTAGAEPAALAAKAATKAIPIVFVVNGNPISIGLVDSLSKPGGNATGMSLIASMLEAKRLEMLREMVPKTPLIAVLVNPDYADTDYQVGVLETAASNASQKIDVLSAHNEQDLSAVFATIAQEKAGALLVAADPLFNRLHKQVVALAARYKVPAIYESREFVAAGGLASYGASIGGAYRGAGVYAGRILKGANPTDLPIQLPTMFELVINLTAAKTIGLEIAPTFLARADDVIE
jgi:putative tryptophan/tyrosine transport system substrate-binding protein